MRLSKIACAFFLAGLSMYCSAAEESRLELIYSPTAMVEQRSTPIDQATRQMPHGAGTCTIVVNVPNDVRKNKDSLGTTFADNPIVSGHSPTIWLEAALMDLSRQGFSTVAGRTPGSLSATRVATVSADLDKLYVWNHSLNLHATLVVRATITVGGETLTKSYRINSTKLNWWNGDAEFVETLNLAAGRLLEQIGPDIRGICGSEKGT